MSLVSCKPFGEMTLPELRADYLRFAAATAPDGFAHNHPSWHDIRDTLATWIARREREEQAVRIDDALGLGDIDAHQAEGALRRAGVDPSEIADRIEANTQGAAA